MSDHHSGGSARNTVSDKVSARVKEAAADAAGAAVDEAQGQLDAGSDLVAGVAASARAAASRLDDAMPGAARLVESSADAAEKLSQTLRESSLSEMADSFGGFAARQPAVLVGCGVLAGFLLAQLLPSSR